MSARLTVVVALLIVVMLSSATGRAILITIGTTVIAEWVVVALRPERRVAAL